MDKQKTTQWNDNGTRKYQATFLIGQQESGKTYFIKDIIIKNALKNGRTVIIYDPSFQEAYKEYNVSYVEDNPILKGIIRIDSEELDIDKGKLAVANYLYANAKDAWLILEDSIFGKTGNATNNLLNIVRQFRHRRLDIILVSHSLSLVPNMLVDVFFRVILFYSTSNTSKSNFQSRWGEFSIILEAYQKIKSMPPYSFIDILYKENRIVRERNGKN